MDQTFPILLKSVETGNVYRFTTPSAGVVVSLGSPHTSREVGEYCDALIHYTSPNWIRVEPELIPYDPTQQGETDNDI